MSKIMDFLLQPDTIIFFDVDGVLAPYEFGKLRHCIGDYEWKQRLEAGEDLYSMISPIKLLQAFIKRKGTDNIYMYVPKQLQRNMNPRKNSVMRGTESRWIIFF